MKTCKVCLKDFPVEDFPARSARCKPCHNAYTREHYQQNKQYYSTKARKNQKKYSDALDQLKSTTPCTDCGNIFPSECMDFDHISDNKTANVSKYRGWGIGGKLAEEIAKCELVCANCHRIRTRKRLLA